MVYHLLLERSEKLSLEDFCSLYILLRIFEFLCPNRNERVFPILFTIVNDFGSSGKYNWGGVVYDYLVMCICYRYLLFNSFEL